MYVLHNNQIFEHNNTNTAIWHHHSTLIRTRQFRLHIIGPSNQVTSSYHPVFPCIHTDQLNISVSRRDMFRNHDISKLPKLPAALHYFQEFTHPLQANSFDVLCAADNIQIYVSTYQYVSNLAVGWIISVNNETIYQDKTRLQQTSCDSRYRGHCQSVIAAIQHYKYEHLIRQCPLPRKNIQIYTTNLPLANKIMNYSTYCATASKQFQPEHESLYSVYTLIRGLKTCELIHVLIPTSTKLLTDPVTQTHQVKLQHCHQHAANATTMYSNEIELEPEHYHATVYINDRETPTNIPDEIRYAALSPALRTHFKKKYKLSETTIESIDWEVHSKALNRQHTTMRKTITQFIHRWLPTHGHPGTKHDITTKCPGCHTAEETNDHFLLCTNTEIQIEWQQQIHQVYDDLQKLQLDPILTYYTILAIDQWKTISKPEQPPFCYDKYYQLFREQSMIGWDHVIYGRLTKSWVDIQNDYSSNNANGPNGISLISKAISKIYQLVYHVWKYRCDVKYRNINMTTYRNNILNPKIQQLYATQETLNAIDKN